MLSVFALLMSDIKLLCNKIYYTYLGRIMVPSPYQFPIDLNNCLIFKFNFKIFCIA